MLANKRGPASLLLEPFPQMSLKGCGGQCYSHTVQSGILHPYWLADRFSQCLDSLYIE